LNRFESTYLDENLITFKREIGLKAILNEACFTKPRLKRDGKLNMRKEIVKIWQYTKRQIGQLAFHIN